MPGRAGHARHERLGHRVGSIASVSVCKGQPQTATKQIVPERGRIKDTGEGRAPKKLQVDLEGNELGP